ncbi:sulfite exporter TauE/SafE family protein [Wenzhouxiangella limi]|uniref:Probable membrane transporter protein n=1 Tax=Wenzhouxiangella limi TaxID=2707351 RepID=A0A845UYN0_9GAMM|nr:sulfite exporter TauE/SafE family protein [Wenzhouxiangella limi]NDY95828.1 sulfite exporter TauE/SafE family protein [Wenzhouxiangella limi]
MTGIVARRETVQQVLLLVLLLLITGLTAGLLAGLLGIGGGLVIVPALSFLLRARGVEVEIAVPVAVATSLGTMLLTSASAVWFHARRDAVHWPTVARLAPAMAVGAGLGAVFAAALPGQLLAKVFALLAALIGIRMLLSLNPSRPPISPYPRGWWLAGPAIGGVSALMGIGGGSFNVPYLVRNGFAPVQAVAIASACGWPIALGGVVGFLIAGWNQHLLDLSLGYLFWPGVVVVGMAGAVSAPAGVALAHRLPAAGLRRIFGLLLLLIAVRMFW